MVIFHSYVSLPEGKCGQHCFGNIKLPQDWIPEPMNCFFCIHTVIFTEFSVLKDLKPKSIVFTKSWPIFSCSKKMIISKQYCQLQRTNKLYCSSRVNQNVHPTTSVVVLSRKILMFLNFKPHSPGGQTWFPHPIQLGDFPWPTIFDRQRVAMYSRIHLISHNIHKGWFMLVKYPWYWVTAMYPHLFVLICKTNLSLSLPRRFPKKTKQTNSLQDTRPTVIRGLEVFQNLLPGKGRVAQPISGFGIFGFALSAGDGNGWIETGV